MLELHIGWIVPELVVRLFLQKWNSTEEKQDGRSEDWTENPCPLSTLGDAGRHNEESPPEANLTCIVGVPRPTPKTDIAPLPPVGRVVPEVELLDVRHCLHQQTKHKEDPSRYVPSSPVSEDFT